MALVIFSMLKGASRPSRFRILVGILIPPVISLFTYIGANGALYSVIGDISTLSVACQGMLREDGEKEAGNMPVRYFIVECAGLSDTLNC
jgi:hypothetical protein